MLTKTDAIVLSLQEHTDKCRLLHAYTRAGGHAIYMVYGRKFNPSPLARVELVYDQQPTRSMQQLKSGQLTHIDRQDDMTRRCVRMFVAEMIQLTLRHPMEDEKMYRFLEATVQDIDECDDPQDSHLRFLIGLSMRLGLGEIEVDTPANRAERQAALRRLCAHFAEHIDDFCIPKSLDVLTEIFE